MSVFAALVCVRRQEVNELTTRLCACSRCGRHLRFGESPSCGRSPALFLGVDRRSEVTSELLASRGVSFISVARHRRKHFVLFLLCKRHRLDNYIDGLGKLRRVRVVDSAEDRPVSSGRFLKDSIVLQQTRAERFCRALTRSNGAVSKAVGQWRIVIDPLHSRNRDVRREGFRAA